MAFVTETNRKWWALGALCFSLFMIMLDNTVVSLALPTIEEDIGASLSQLEWVINAYALVFAVLLLPAGKLADFLGRRRIFIAGLVVFTLSSLACGLASSGGVLIGARAVQGLGAALMLPATLSIISATFPAEERGMAIGIWAGVSGAALAIGPLIGAVLVENAGWEWIFYINIPVGIVGVFATIALVSESRDTSKEQRLDLLGLVTSAAGIFLLTFALTESNNYGWSSATILLCFVGSAVALVLFVVVEARQRLPMLDLSFFRNPTFTGANIGGFGMFVALFGFVFFISLYLQSVLHYSVLEAGGTFLVTTVAIMLAAPISGMLTDTIGPRWLLTAGMALWGISMLALSSIVETDTGFWEFVPWFVVGGLGFGLVMPPMTAAILGAVHVDKAGVASGVMQAFRQLGGALGVAVGGAIIASKIGDLTPRDRQYGAEFVDGFQDVLLLIGIVALVTAVVAALMVRDRPTGIEAEAHAPSIGM
jgi:EmrB/QacA subfamily drug resistance transporter